MVLLRHLLKNTKKNLPNYAKHDIRTLTNSILFTLKWKKSTAKINMSYNGLRLEKCTVILELIAQYFVCTVYRSIYAAVLNKVQVSWQITGADTRIRRVLSPCSIPRPGFWLMTSDFYLCRNSDHDPFDDHKKAHPNRTLRCGFLRRNSCLI